MPLNHLTKKEILLIDNCPSHKYDELEMTLKSYGYELIYLPANSTDVLQPLDLTVNKAFKSKYREYFEEYIE